MLNFVTLAASQPPPEGDAAAAGVLGLMCLVSFCALAVLTLALYFLPAVIACVRSHPDWMSVVALNVLLGWTLVGYAVALAWSLTRVPRSPR